jgi:DNA repair protein RadA/Sms
LEPIAPRSGQAASPAAIRSYPEIDTTDVGRTSTGLGELDRVLGGGLVPGAVILVGGEPGIGKSTLLLQAASLLAEAGRKVLYVSAEESPTQLRSRGDRLGVRARGLLVAAETNVDAVIAAARQLSPAAIIVDSIQAMRCAELDSVPGSVSQVREAASRVVAHAKATDIPAMLVGHVTKEGSIAGPRTLEHVVDTVIQFEGDRRHEHRLLRAQKNRFGTTDELGVFRMTDRGLAEVTNPSELLLAERDEGVPGSAVLAAVEGTRPLLVEIQALVGEATQGSPRRTALGVDPNRVALVLAVLQRRIGLDLAQRDVFVNVTGGVSVTEPAADLAVASAAVSSALQKPLPAKTVWGGEIGLTGEIRAVSRMDSRLREAARLGFTTAVAPDSRTPTTPPDGLRLVPVRRVEDAFRHGLGVRP